MSLLGSVLCGLLCAFSFSFAESKFQAYWNVPLDACTGLGVYFDLDQFSIVHNTGNPFYGDKVINDRSLSTTYFHVFAIVMR